jgi:Tfp pilus assembly protein PilV
MERAVNARRQRGAALLIVVALFLILLPLALMAIFNRSLQNDQFANSALWRAQARDAANQAMAALRANVAQTIGNGGLLEYQPNPPSWYVSPSAQLQPTSASFWQTCAANNLCQSTQVTLNNGTGRQTFTVLQLVTPTGVIDPTLCGQSGYVAVFYNLWVQATATQNPAAGSASEQSVYRACVPQGS